MKSIRLPASLTLATTLIGCGIAFDLTELIGPDPLLSFQWYYDSSDNDAEINEGEGINIGNSITRDGINGENITIAIVDTGLEIDHEDLRSNIAEGVTRSHNFLSTALDETDPTSTVTNGDHGTSVAGLAAAEGWNDVGIRGIAPKASLVGYNLVGDIFEPNAEATQTLENALNSLGAASYSEGVDIFNLSIGAVYPYRDLDENTEDFENTTSGSAALDDYLFEEENGLKGLRAGKGGIIVKSAGNESLTVELSEEFENENQVIYEASRLACTVANAQNLPCGSANFDPWNNIPTSIIVGAITSSNQRAEFSNPGSALWVSAPGGGDLLTTDQSGCDQGYNVTPDGNSHIEVEDRTINVDPDCNYFVFFNGTSAATPIVSGAIALILDANPDLSYRDVKRILALTADQIDPDYDELSINIGDTPLVVLQEWTENDAGILFSEQYGFGKINISQALAAAADYNTDLGGERNIELFSPALNENIPTADATGLSSTIEVTENLQIEAVQIRVNIEHENPEELSLSVTSPAGITSVLLMPHNPLDFFENLTKTFITNAFLDEEAEGIWTIRVHDVIDSNTATPVSGTLVNWSIRIFGRSI